MAVIILTAIVKLILFPISQKSIKTQVKMKDLEPELAKIKENYKDKREEQALKTMALYKERGINPFASILLLFIQIPIILGLYLVFVNGGLPNIDMAHIYSFVPIPTDIDMNFLGLIDMSKKSLILAILAGISQYFQALVMPVPQRKKEGSAPSFQDDFARSMSMQMKYVFPVMIFFFAWSISGVIALYWTVSNLFTIGQELYVRKKLKNGQV
jgi:YidC/Oxa1 family membrane protein insertase